MKPLQALTLAVGDLMRPRIFGVLALGVALTLLLFAALQAGVFWVIQFLAAGLSLPLWITDLPLAGVLSWGSLMLLPVMGYFLMAPVAAGFAGLFAERVSDTVEDIHYPDQRGQSVDFWDGLLESALVVGAMLLIGILHLILLPFLGPLAPVLFYGANGWLLGREFFQLAASRHFRPEQATQIRKRYSGQATALGILIAFLLTVPVLNITIPVLAAAAFTHLFHLTGQTPRYRRE